MIALLVLLAGSEFAAVRDTEVQRVQSTAHYFERIANTVCLRCHQGKEPKGGLDLSTRAGLLRGGDSGPAIVAGDPDASLLLRRVVEGSMPPIGDGDPLPPADIDHLRRWIQEGAAWPTERPVAESRVSGREGVLMQRGVLPRLRSIFRARRK